MSTHSVYFLGEIKKILGKYYFVMLSTSLGKRFLAWLFILNGNIDS